MKDVLRDALTPADDGRAFTDAVLLEASGALHRRRAAAEQVPALDWLARWARPWVVAALAAIAVVSLIPAGQVWIRGTTANTAAAGTSADSEAMAASLLPADMALAAATEDTQER